MNIIFWVLCIIEFITKLAGLPREFKKESKEQRLSDIEEYKSKIKDMEQVTNVLTKGIPTSSIILGGLVLLEVMFYLFAITRFFNIYNIILMAILIAYNGKGYYDAHKFVNKDKNFKLTKFPRLHKVFKIFEFIYVSVIFGLFLLR